MIEIFADLVKAGKINESEVVELKHLLLDMYKDLKEVQTSHETVPELRLKFHSALFTKRFREIVNRKI